MDHWPGLPSRSAGQAHLAVRLVLEAVSDVVGQHVIGPAGEGAARAIGVEGRRAAGKLRPSPPRPVDEPGMGRPSGFRSDQRLARRNHRIEKHQASDALWLTRRSAQACSPAHGVAGQNDIGRIHGVQQREQVVAEIVPAGPAFNDCRQVGGAVTALVDGEDAESVRQRRQNTAISQGVEAVGVQEDQIARTVSGPEVENGDRAPAPPPQGDEAAREGGLRCGGYFFAGVLWPVASWIRAAILSVESAAWLSMLSGEAPGLTALTT